MIFKTKKGMMNQMVAIAFGIVTLAIVVGIGLTVLTKLSGATACPTGWTYNVTDTTCNNASGYGGFAINSAGTSINYAITQLGSTGLLSWLPAIIALLVGIFFLMYFMGGKKNR